MAIKINLLPPESTISGPVAQMMKVARMLNVIFLGVFLVVGFGLGVFFVVSSLQLQDLNATNNKLKGQITAQETSEQQLVLLKDRLAKIQTVKNLPDTTKNMVKVDPFIRELVGNTSLTELEVDAQKTDLSVLFRTNSDLTNFLKSMSDNKVYKSSILSSFGYNPSSGYLVSVHLL